MILADNTCELVRALEHEWRDAVCAKEMDRLRALIHPRFTLIGTRSTGAFKMSREEWLEAIQRRELVAIELGIADAIVLDQAIIGTIEAKWRVRYLGREIEDCVLLTDVWVMDEGRWRVIRRHSSPVQDFTAN